MAHKSTSGKKKWFLWDANNLLSWAAPLPEDTKHHFPSTIKRMKIPSVFKNEEILKNPPKIFSGQDVEKTVLITSFSDQRQHFNVHKWIKLTKTCFYSHLSVLPSYKVIKKRGQGEASMNLLSSKTSTICCDYLLKTIVLLKLTPAKLVWNGYQAFIDFRLFASIYGLVNTSYCATDWRTIPLHGVYKMIS